MRISDCSSDVCSSDLNQAAEYHKGHGDAYDDGARGDDLTVALFFFVAAVFVLEVRDGFEDGESLGGQGRDKQAVTDLGGQSQAGRGACEEARASPRGAARRSEEQTAELQSLMRNAYADFCLKKK